MQTSSTQRLRAAEQMLENLTLCEKSLDIPGNFRAKQRRAKHDDSRSVFPLPRRKQPGSYKSHYTLHFKSKPNGRPSSPRPCSPTRRNNPHPSKNFLNWRIPTRVFDYGKEKNANIKFLKSNVEDTYESFYDDYSGMGRERAIDPKLLLEMTKSYGGTHKRDKKKRTIELSALNGNDYNKHKGGLSLPALLRKSWSPDEASFGLKSSTKRRPIVSPEPEFRPLFQSWYDVAASQEKQSSKSAAAVQAEENYIKEALSMALKPDAIEAIENWLLDANEEERAIAVQFIQAIILASVENKQEDASPILRPTRHTPHHNHHMKKGCNVCQQKELESALQQLQTIATKPMPIEIPAVTELLNPLHPIVVAQREARLAHKQSSRKLHRSRNPQTAFLANKGSLFDSSKKPKGRHFTIHPEWH